MPRLAAYFLFVLALTCGAYLFGAWRDERGRDQRLVAWEALGSPPERAQRLAGIGFQNGAYDVVAETAAGRRYYCCWQPAQTDLFVSRGNCPSLEPLRFPLDALPGRPVDCVGEMQWEWVTEYHYYVLLEDGSVWSWDYRYGLGDHLFNAYILPALGFAAALLLAMGHAVWGRIRRRAKQTGSETTRPPS